MPLFSSLLRAVLVVEVTRERLGLFFRASWDFRLMAMERGRRLEEASAF